MEQWMMDAEGGRVIHQRRRTGKLAVVVAVQNVVVAACLIATLFLYLDFQKDTSSDTVAHIEFYPITVTNGSGNVNITLTFPEIASNYSMDVNKDKSKIYIKCKGPYIWYMDVCFKSLGKREVAKGRLELKMADTTVSYATLNTASEVCRGHQSIVYLRANTESSVQLISTGQFKLMNVTMGLSSLLGKRCEF